MWILSLEWLVLALVVFWVVGAFKRLKRLRQGVKHAFVAVDVQLAQSLELLRNCARLQTLKEKVVGMPLEQTPHALQPCADMLAAALIQAKQQPLAPEAIAALDSAWQGAQSAWQVYAQLSGAQAGASDQHFQEWTTRWEQLISLHQHSAAQFNTAVNDYNTAIAQLPACAVARLIGLKPARNFQKDAALQMQPSA